MMPTIEMGMETTGTARKAKQASQAKGKKRKAKFLQDQFSTSLIICNSNNLQHRIKKKKKKLSR